jgi:hypothetical protein
MRISKLPRIIWISGIAVALFALIALLAPWIANDPSHSAGPLPLVKYGPESVDIFQSEFFTI